MGRPRLLIFYHYFHPDQVVSARIFSGLRGGAGQARVGRHGADLQPLARRDDRARRLPAEERGRACEIQRVFRPAGRRNKPLPRLGNSAWLLSRVVSAIAASCGAFDAIVIGSDPSFAASLAIPLRLSRPQRRSFTGASTSSPTPSRPSGRAPTRLLSQPGARAHERRLPAL